MFHSAFLKASRLNHRGKIVWFQTVHLFTVIDEGVPVNSFHVDREVVSIAVGCGGFVYNWTTKVVFGGIMKSLRLLLPH